VNPMNEWLLMQCLKQILTNQRILLNRVSDHVLNSEQEIEKTDVLIHQLNESYVRTPM
jgi:hypothetical protein